MSASVHAGWLLAVDWPVVRRNLGDWAPAAEIAVAVGTILLAAATFRLARQAKRQATTIGEQVALERQQLAQVIEQVALERQQLEAGQRPFVVPIVDGWDPGASPPWIRLSNAGAGPAYNVRGGLFWPHGIGGGVLIGPTTVPAGQPPVAVPLAGTNWTGREVDWVAATGYLRYTDLASTEWQTHFRFWVDPFSGQLAVEVVGVGRTAELGEPVYTNEGDWQSQRVGENGAEKPATP